MTRSRCTAWWWCLETDAKSTLVVLDVFAAQAVKFLAAHLEPMLLVDFSTARRWKGYAIAVKDDSKLEEAMTALAKAIAADVVSVCMRPPTVQHLIPVGVESAVASDEEKGVAIQVVRQYNGGRTPKYVTSVQMIGVE